VHFLFYLAARYQGGSTGFCSWRDAGSITAQAAAQWLYGPGFEQETDETKRQQMLMGLLAEEDR
jgi:hypothetical protein